MRVSFSKIKVRSGRACNRARRWTFVAIEQPESSYDKRRELQRMIERACDDEYALDVIIVHSFSIVDRIEVDDRSIWLVDRRDVLEQAVLAEAGGAASMVHSFVPKWRAGLNKSANTYVIEAAM